jgi:hypothetical protein
MGAAILFVVLAQVIAAAGWDEYFPGRSPPYTPAWPAPATPACVEAGGQENGNITHLAVNESLFVTGNKIKQFAGGDRGCSAICSQDIRNQTQEAAA